MQTKGFTNPNPLGEIPDGWQVRSIDSLCLKVTSGGTPLRSNRAFYINGTIKWLKTQELKDWYIDDSEEKITPEAVEKSSAKIFPANTVLMAMYGDGKTITSLGIIRKEAATNQACCAMIANPDICYYLYLFYTLKYHRPDFIHIATGGAQRNLSGLLIRNFAIKVPPLPEQKAIAHILGTLDDKIELNREMNKTLEAMARAIFKSWFVDFDPVRAKMEGRQPAGMDAATAELFPDEFEESALGMVPKGWNTVPFEELFLIPLRNGLTRPKAVRGQGTYMVNMGELFAYRRIGDIEMDRVPLTESEAEKNLLQTGDLLFARQSLTLEGAGQSSIVIEAKEPRTFESHLIRCRLNPDKAISWYYFYYFQSNEGRGKIWSLVEQVAAAGIRGSDLAKLNVLAPAIKIQRCFGAVVEPLEKKIASNDSESRTLASIRDTLLPKLLSGEIRVKEAEKIVETQL